MLATSLLFIAACLLYNVHSSPTSFASSLTVRDAISDCNGGSYNGPHADGQGTYVTSDSVSHPYRFPSIRKCWQDYFYTDSKVEFLPWQKSSGDRYCTGTVTCSVAKLNGTQVCQTRSTSVSVEVGAAFKGISAGLSVTFGLDDQQCFSASDTTQCTWDDQGCHTVWTQQQILKTWGYMRKKCNWGNGDVIECMSNIEIDTPTTTVNYGCGSSCAATNECGHTDGTPCS